MFYSDKALEKGLRKTFLNFFAEEAPAIVGQLAEHVSSDSDKEEHEWLGPTGVMEPFEDEVKFISPTSSGFAVPNVIYTKGFVVDRDHLRRSDAQTGSLRMRINQLALRARSFYVKLLMEAIEANPDCYDKTSMFGNSHTARKNEGGVQDNNLALTGSTTANIQTDLALALQAMLGFVDEEGEPFHGDGMAMNLMIVCSVNLEQRMREALEASIISNTTNVNAGIAQLYTSPRITASTWYLFRIDPMVKPWIQQEELPVSFEAVESGETWTTKRQAQYVVAMSGAIAPGYWQSGIKIS